MLAREGDLLKTKGNIVFDVKGLVHPPDKTIAFPRFILDPSGNRWNKGQTYKKIYNLSARFQYLKKRFPQYIVHDLVFDETLCEIPVNVVKEHYKPIEKLLELRSSKKLNGLERTALHLSESLKEVANISWHAIGISGSLLAGLHIQNKSDIDLIVYGIENCQKVYSSLTNLLQDGTSHFRPYTREDLQNLFDFRSKDTLMGFEEFVTTESRKVLQGKFMETDYFIRFVKKWSEIKENYGDVYYKNCGYAKIKGTIADDWESVFTPCKYKVENVTVIEGAKLPSTLEVGSFRGRFCEQARRGETIIAQGKVERIINNKQECECFRILLGNKPNDYMALL